MEPKFQSSFIPKGPASTTATATALPRKAYKERSLFSFISVIIFVLSFIAAFGLFGYKYYLERRIDTLAQELDRAWTTLEPETITQLTDLDARIRATQELVTNHQVILPVFEFMESNTPVTVKFSNLSYTNGAKGPEITMQGEARGYTALAFLSDIFSQSGHFKNAIFSDFALSQEGNVTFSFNALINQELLSYPRQVEQLAPAQVEESASTIEAPQN